MAKIKTKAELKKAKEDFYNAAMQDEEIRLKVNLLPNLSSESKEYHQTLDEIYDYLDKKFKEHIGYET